jgi:hypothetical protein
MTGGSGKDWDKELAKIDKQLESISDAQLFPDKKTPSGAPAAPAQRAQVADERAATASWPAILRLTLSVILGVGILFWPYGNRCGVGLFGYLASVAVVLAAGVWSSVWTWRHRTARAHVLSILLIVYGLILGAVETLPRIGYARQWLPWSCVVAPSSGTNIGNTGAKPGNVPTATRP